ncbi:MAG: hypothetical protein QMC38_14055 [Sinobacterium sp.]
MECPSIHNSIVIRLTSIDFEKRLPSNEVFYQLLKVLTQLKMNTVEQKVSQVEVSELDNKYFVNFISSDQTEY